MELSHDQIEAIGKATAVELRKHDVHCISFDEETRKTIHIVHEARKEAGAEHGDIVMTFKVGRDLNSTMKDGIRRIIAVMIIIGVLIIAFLALKAWGVSEFMRTVAPTTGGIPQ